MSTPDQQKLAAKTANALLKKDINNEDVEQGLIPLILDMFTRHQKTMKAFQDYAKKQVMDGVKVDGWFLKPGARVRSFTKLVELHQYLAEEYNCDAETFRKHCSINTSGVKEIVKDGMEVGTPAHVIERKVDELVQQFGESKVNSPSLKPEPKKKAAA